MNVLLMTIGAFRNISESGAYTDLLRFFQRQGHSVFVACTTEKRQGLPTCVEEQGDAKVLRIRVGNITKVNFLEKGISTLLINKQFKNAIRKCYKNVKFDIVLYSTPPITLAGVVGNLKRRDGCFTYLMLKDIFPAGALDLGVLKKTGIKGMIYCYFRSIEKKLYRDSDAIGCMSMANKRYLLKYNAWISEEKVGICPNTIDVIDKDTVDKQQICKKYNLPENKILLLYGGNFGLPQNVNYVVDVMYAAKKMQDIHFVMCGSGTEFHKIHEYGEQTGNNNVTVINALPYADYKELLGACDAGLLFLDYKFEVPNFPSRLLDYMNYELPVIAATDVHTDVGETILAGKFGWWCESRSQDDYMDMLGAVVEEWKNNRGGFAQRGMNAKKYLERNFRTEIAYDVIIKGYNKWRETADKQVPHND